MTPPADAATPPRKRAYHAKRERLLVLWAQRDLAAEPAPTVGDLEPEPTA